MASACKINANRANAQASTGPRTAHGKARSARNALRHGLSLPVSADPNLAEEVRALGLKLAGANPSMDMLQHALLVAEAQVELNRIRRARHNLLRQQAGELNRAPGDGEVVENSPVSRNYQDTETLELFERSPMSKNPLEKGAQAAPLQLDPAVLNQLIKIGRYERRTLSKRKFAIRKFDQVRQRQLKARKRHQQSTGGAGLNSL